MIFYFIAGFFIVGFMLGGIAATYFCACKALKHLQVLEDYYIQQAVESGHAEFYLDQNRERQWRWMTNRANP